MRKDKEMPIGKIMWWVLIITSIEINIKKLKKMKKFNSSNLNYK